VYRDYKNKGWKNMGDWLGTGNIASYDIDFLSYQDARRFVQKLGLKNQRDWLKYCKSGKKPKNIPSTPWAVYRKMD